MTEEHIVRVTPIGTVRYAIEWRRIALAKIASRGS